MRKLLSLMLIFSMLGNFGRTEIKETRTKSRADTISANEFELSVDVGSAYLIEAKTGKVIYAKNELKASPPASVTKIMTLLLACEALEAGKFKLTDTVTISAHAASMGGSQVFLEEGERMSVEELIKCAVIASANDAAVSLAELCAGSESAFVRKMNQRAAELGLKSTKFENATGLDDTVKEHYSCAFDIAKMSRELIKHEIITKYSSLWQETIRNGEFTLTNTNRLVRYYDGCNGLKTGSTDKAGFCVSASAKRGNMQLIAVIMGANTSAERNRAATELLDYGFANYALYERGEELIEVAEVLSGVKDSVSLYSSPFVSLIERSRISSVELVFDIPDKLTAPINKGESIGSIIYKIDGEQIGKSEIYPAENIEKITVGEIFKRILKRMICA